MFTASRTMAFHVCAGIDLPPRVFHSDNPEIIDAARKVSVSFLVLRFFRLEF
jgi:hypothetical protein